MPRRRTLSDEAVLDAALAIVRESGPDALSFASLAGRVGLAGSTIVQRFGSKPNLLRAALLRAWDHLDDETARADRDAARDPSGAVDLLVRLSGQYDADTYADQLLVLREDLRDPVLRARGQVWFATLAKAVDERLGEAVPGDARGLGRLVVAQWQGILTVWSFHRRDPVETVVREALEELLGHLGVWGDRGART